MAIENKVKKLDISLIDLNEGQIDGLAKNPRFIKDERYEALKKSIADAPEMLEYRTLLVYPLGDRYVTIAGNMRLRACRELKFTELPCYVLSEETPVEKLREYTIKDNISFGNMDWDLIANDWDTGELSEWGMDTSFLGDGNETDIDSFFDEAPTDAKPKPLKIEIEIPSDMEDAVDEIKDTIRESIASYEGVKIK
jgi:ParB-like chromosome segregation protein Spo0J